MKRPGGPAAIAAILSFNGGFVDTVSFLGLQGLFTSHVTGNFVTLGAALVTGSHGYLNKLLALPAFVIVIALARLAGAMMRARNLPVLRIFLVTEVALLATFFALAVMLGPFEDADTPAGLITGFTGVAAMALQNAFQRVHFADLPPTTIMTGNTTQATMDAIDLFTGAHADERPKIRARFRRMAASIGYFALGCAIAAALYAMAGFWSLGMAVLAGLAAAFMRRDAE